MRTTHEWFFVVRPCRPATTLPLLAVLLAACASGAPATVEPRPQAEMSSSTHATVTADEIDRMPGETIDKFLLGRVPGVVETPTSDGGVAIRIRSATSLNGNNDPL